MTAPTANTSLVQAVRNVLMLINAGFDLSSFSISSKHYSHDGSVTEEDIAGWRYWWYGGSERDLQSSQRGSLSLSTLRRVAECTPTCPPSDLVPRLLTFSPFLLYRTKSKEHFFPFW